MRLGGEPVGRWGIALLAITAITGTGLAVHGWSSRSGGATPGLASGSQPAATAPAASSQPAASSPPAASPPAASPSASPAASAGPLLSSEPYARAAFQIWPGTPGTAAKAAMTGLSVSVHKRGSGLSVTAGVNGQQAGAPHTYPGGAKVYVVEASMGDDSGSSDYNLGDDGLVVTDSKGRIVQ
jgi:hypothetical protein